MKTRLLTAALAVTFAFSACQPNAAGGGNTAGGSVAVSKDDALVYAADGDLDKVFVYDTKQQQVVSAISVGRQPEKVLVAPDGTLFVTNRLGRSVSVIHQGETTEAAKLKTAVEPVGLALTEDGKTLYVVNAASLQDTDFGTVMAFDTNTLAMKWETPVGQEPRGLTLVGDGRLAVSLSKQGDLVFLDSKSGKVVRNGTGVFEQLNASALGIAKPGTNVGIGMEPRPLDDPGFFKSGPLTTHPRAMEALTVSPSGKQLFAAAQLASDSIVQTSTGVDADGNPLPVDPGSSGSGYGGGGCGGGSITSPALVTFSGEGDPLVDDQQQCFSGDRRTHPSTVLVSPSFEQPIQGPRAIALDSTGVFAFVVNESSNNVAVISTKPATTTSATFEMQANTDGVGALGGMRSGSDVQLVTVGAGPSGIALSHDGTKAWVYNAFDHSLSTLEAVSGGLINTGTLRLNTILPFEQQERLSLDAQAGRRLFFSAVDPRMDSLSTGIACSSCHVEGREDGQVWNFPQGPRQTPSLAGRNTMQTAPFHWAGEFDNLTQFMAHTVQERMGGTGVDPDMERQLAAYISSIPTPDNALKETTPADVLARGQAAFTKAECDTCHTTANFTDNSFADVGTFVGTGAVLDDASLRPHGGLNTPSILSVARTAPYLHDGSAQTLRSRIMKGKQSDLHGKTSALSDDEVNDLVAYLKTL